jgi:hypothetical protein
VTGGVPVTVYSTLTPSSYVKVDIDANIIIRMNICLFFCGYFDMLRKNNGKRHLVPTEKDSDMIAKKSGDTKSGDTIPFVEKKSGDTIPFVEGWGSGLLLLF